MKLITALVIASSALAANAQAPAPGPSVGVADMLDDMAIGPIPGMTLGELLSVGTPCEPYKTLIPKSAPILNSIILANLNNVIIDYKLPEAAGTSYFFAPTDEAFDKTLASLRVLNITSLIEISEEDVMEILRLHVAGELPGSPDLGDLINLDLSPVILDVAFTDVISGGSSAGIVEDLSSDECPKNKLFTIDSVFLPKSIRDAIANATPAPAPAPTGGASSASFGVAAILAGVVALFA